MNRASPASIAAAPRSGISLLEVLVASGILVIGLSSIAALLPASASRLGQATTADRTGTMAANARAEVLARGLAAADLFSAFAGTTKACVFGEVATALVSNTSPAPWMTSTATASAVLPLRIDPVRGFSLEDDLAYGAPNTADTPRNAFAISGTAGPRLYNAGVCWGGMLTPRVSPAVAGGMAASSVSGLCGLPATLSVAVFRKSGTAKPFQLFSVNNSTSLLQLKSGTTSLDEADRKMFLGGCSYVLALPIDHNKTWPAWVPVTSSWTITGTTPPSAMVQATGSTFCLLSWGVVPPTDYVRPTVPGNFVGFSTLIRLDEYPVTLD